METPEGVQYLLESCGFRVNPVDINLKPETRWIKSPEAVG
jgi:hypothetical protein